MNRRPRQDGKPAGRVSAGALLLGAAVCLLAALVVLTQARVYALRQEIAALEAEIEEPQEGLRERAAMLGLQEIQPGDEVVLHIRK